MFRRQTDQVYEMLQQVQRQMTNAADSGSSWSSQHSGSSPQAGGQAPQAWPSPMQLRPPARQPEAAQSPDTRIQTAGYAPQPVRGLNWALASVLMLLWLLTIGVAYTVGRHHAAASQQLGPVGYAPDESGNRQIDDSRPPPVPVVAGDRLESAVSDGGPSDILILKSVRSFDPATLERWQRDADRLNGLNAKIPSMPPYFAVRQPGSGGLQLVFGLVDGRFGVERGTYESQATMLREEVYSGAIWKSLR
jgi:hypothetical protein